MDRIKINSSSPESTIEIAANIGRHLQRGDIVTLEGDLGAGKTHFAKGIAQALHVKNVVNSPTFTIIKEYEGDFPFYHMDVYRLEEDEVDELGIEEYLEGDGVCLIEWAGKIIDLLPTDILRVTILRKSDMERTICLEDPNDKFEALFKELQNHENTSN
ncbi:tRNA (adenosine(37)-N6)-threonylcarbamoyltransferase complex ATPase subunit type 1 TsaE [Alteribacillus iranensis]|uniref:tRNA threonylcarbamoyladenosine biosynthesis protein TsaE n=1 Tax=Alteribacillus iranensis TaxID=930128 RepID=A0A1I2ECV2_9BACI|nr:tRNA (adenosine(37)-N6)-threonylcarbamoyltransferase complex ATPase subunit type 1 TsaE [Alteribacillus iranensis]SFE90497.1 tRNA threonylcarbamoyladenosine biosynthesis protein TsaE [Alteribacillus iranensis]